MKVRRITGPHGGRVCRKAGCGFQLDIRTDGNGGTIAECPGCERSRRRLCLECPAKIPKPARSGVARPLRCPTCRVKHDRDVRNTRDRLNYADNSTAKIRANRKWRRDHAETLKRKAKEKRDAERAKGPPSPIDRLYWREKTKRWRAGLTPEQRTAYNRRKRKPKSLEVAA